MNTFRRMKGIYLRHYYLWTRNPEYFFDTFWQPIVEVFIWGFISTYLSSASTRFASLVSFFLGAVILWSVLRRAQHEITFSLMEEAWSRNLQNILMSPVNMFEYYAASIGFGMVKMVVEISLMIGLMGLIFKFNAFVLGLSFLPFLVSLLLTGWAIGLVVNSAIIYFGRGLVPLSWIMAFVLQPFACVFYPVSALPGWAQMIAKSFPATWIFEGMRKVLNNGGFDWSYFSMSLLLNMIYLLVSFGIFSWVMKKALEKGFLLRLEW